MPTFEVLYEDNAIFGVSKPAGLLTQAPPGIDSLEQQIKDLIKHRDAKGGRVYLGVPHRLDRPVSGAMVFAKHSRAARLISKQFERRDVEKIYWACTQGTVEPAEGTWRDYIRKIPGEPKAQIVAEDDPEARLGVLHYRTLGASAFGSWLEIRLETGRTHQVRIQSSSRGWPLVGDSYYGATTLFGEPFDDERLRAIALHARSLTFAHPLGRRRMTLTAAVSQAWLDIGLPEWAIRSVAVV